MPTYEYECKSCKYNFEVFQSMKDDPLKICPKCGKEIRRLINGGNGVIFKGNGFYVTDKNGGGAKSGKDSNSAKDGKPDDSGKSSPDKAAGTESSPCAGCPRSGTGSQQDKGSPPAAPACPKAAS